MLWDEYAIGTIPLTHSLQNIITHNANYAKGLHVDNIFR